MEDCKISLGVSADLEEKILKPVMMEFIKKHPNVSIKIINGIGVELIKKLSQYSVDFIIDKDLNNNSKMQEIETKELCILNYALVYNEQYFKDVEEIKELPFIVPVNNTFDRKKIDDYFKDINIKPKIKYEVETLESMLSLVKDGLGVAIVLSDSINNNCHMLAKKQLNLSSNIKLSYIKEKLTPYIKEFIDLFSVEK